MENHVSNLFHICNQAATYENNQYLVYSCALIFEVYGIMNTTSAGDQLLQLTVFHTYLNILLK